MSAKRWPWLLAILLLASLLGHHAGPNRIDNLQLDVQSRWLASRSPPDPRIVFIDIDDASLQAFEARFGKWPWPRSVHAKLLEGLAPIRPASITLDLLLNEADRYRPDDDAYLAETSQRIPGLYFAGTLLPAASAPDEATSPHWQRQLALRLHTQHCPPGTLTFGVLLLPRILPPGTWKSGTIELEQDRDGMVRHYPLGRCLNDKFWPSLASLPAQQPDERTTIRLNWHGTTVLPYPRISYQQLFSDLEHARTKALSRLSGHHLLIGSSATGLHDLHSTPLGSSTPGPTILATALDNLINHNMLHDSPVTTLWLFDTAWLIGLLLLLKHNPSLPALLRRAWPAWLLASSVALLTSLFLQYHGHVLPTLSTITNSSIAMLGYTILQGWEAWQARQHAQRQFSRFMDPTVVRQLLENGQTQPEDLTRQTTLTVLFCDIQGFTTLSEQLPADEVLALLNRHFAALVECVFEHGGTLDKYIGDALMAFWGAPLPYADHADRALAAALKMLDCSARLSQQLQQQYPQCAPFRIGIGLHTGTAMVGMIGSPRRFDYSAIGDTVNLASRIEGLTRGRAPLLVSEQCRNSCQHNYAWQACGEFEVRGRHATVKLYTLPGSSREEHPACATHSPSSPSS